jgi:hypothetical protein
MYNGAVFEAVAEFFGMMGDMGAAIFDLPWVAGAVRLFHLFGWALFAVGMVVAVFDVAIEVQSGRGNPKTTALNIIKGFFATSLFTTVPIQLYRFCINLQTTFLGELTAIMVGGRSLGIDEQSMHVLEGHFRVAADVNLRLFNLLALIAFGYCVIRIFFCNLKRGGIMLIQISVGSLYLFSVPRGYSDGFWQWSKQIAALCLTAFMQTTLLFLGLLTFPDHMLLGLGVMLSASEVPRIAQQFGLDTSAKFNLSSIVHASNSALNIARLVRR